MKYIPHLLLVALCNLGPHTFSQTELFNGKDLTGWQIYGTEKWYVEDGLLVSESGPDAEYGYLGTEQTFKNFELTADFKQVAEGNSGIFIRSSIEGTKISGWQVEVAPPGNNSGGIYESYGRGWLIQPDPKKRQGPQIWRLEYHAHQGAGWDGHELAQRDGNGYTDRYQNWGSRRHCRTADPQRGRHQDFLEEYSDLGIGLILCGTR